MKIDFEDGSFLELEPQKDGSMRFILCGINGYLSTTMSSADLSKEQVTELTGFLMDYQEEEEQHSI